VDRGRVCRMMVRIARPGGGGKKSFGSTGDSFGGSGHSLQRGRSRG
jgi:hypothetical protein